MEITLSWILLVPVIVRCFWFIYSYQYVSDTSVSFVRWKGKSGIRLCQASFKESLPIQLNIVRITLISFSYVHFEFLFLGMFAKLR